MPNRLFSPTMSPDFNEFVSQLMQLTYVGDFPAFRALLGADQPSSTLRYNFQDVSNDFPRIICACGPNFNLACVSGASNISLANNYLAGFYDLDLFGRVSAVPQQNAYVTRVAQQVEANLGGLSYDPQIATFFIGYSLGGATAECLAGRQSDAGYPASPAFTSFGAPKWCDVGVARTFFRIAGRRWFNDADPVPLLPFTESLAPQLVTQFNLGIFNVFSTRAHVPAGVQLFSDGGYDPAVLPSNATIGSLVSMAAWYLGIETASANAHSMLEYRTRLGRLYDFSRNPIAGRITGGGEEVVTNTSRREVAAQEERVATTISAQQAAQNAQPLDVPRERLFSVYRQGRIWNIVFGGQIVALTTDRRTARSLCRQFNTALRHLQTTAFVSPESLGTTLQQYLTAAATPGSGFVPTMQTTINL